MYDIQTVGNNIRKARLTRNYSQDYLAYKLKISQNGYSKVELGHTKITLERLILIADVLQVPLSRLIGEQDIAADVVRVNQIAIVPKLLEVICRTTGMGFAAIARVTDSKWVACAVRDEIQFGLEPGGELELESTICNSIRKSGVEVIFDDADKDARYAQHPTPAKYGFKSYISVPITSQDGTFFGTLCAIDPKPAKVNRIETVGMFRLFADLVSFHLNAVDQQLFTEAALPEPQTLHNSAM